MGISDHEYVNFSEDHELNHHLKKVSKPQTQENRDILKKMGKELKSKLGKERLTHQEFGKYVEDNKNRLQS